MMAIQALALDFDGVIVDSLDRQERAWRAALAKTEPPATGRNSEACVIENLLRGYAGARIFEGSGLSAEQRRVARREKDRRWLQTRFSVPLFSGCREVLPRLATVLPTYIATTAPKDYVYGVLQGAGLPGVIRAVVTDDDVDRPKPDPAMLERIAAIAGVNPSEILMVGDSSTDLEMAERTGSPFLLFAGTVRSRQEGGLDRPMEVVRSWPELEVAALAAAGTAAPYATDGEASGARERQRKTPIVTSGP